MGRDTGISWTDHTFNPWWGCARVSPGCENCYAETFSKRIGLSVWGAKSERRFFGDKHWAEPLKWERDAVKAQERRRVFCASMADVMEDRRDLDDARHLLWDLIAITPHLEWQILTKRPENFGKLLPGAWTMGRPPENVWLGVTAENQATADERIPLLLQTPAAVRFVSYEPALGPVDFTKMRILGHTLDALRGEWCANETGCLVDDKGDGSIDWIIVGGESGPGARPFVVAWARETIRQCKAAGVPCFYKQGGFSNRCPHDAKGGHLECMPEDIRIREFPA